MPEAKISVKDRVKAAAAKSPNTSKTALISKARSPSPASTPSAPSGPTAADRYAHLKEEYKLLILKLTQSEEYSEDVITRLQLEVEYYKEMFLKQK